MGFFDMFRKPKAEPAKAEPAAVTEKVLLPLDGEVIALADIADGVFSEAILGKGCGVKPSGDTLYAPFDGEVTQVAETLHAVGMTTADGVELLMHVGMDTVEMQGDGFKALVKVGDKVKTGTPLLKFDTAKITAAGHPTATAIIVTNTDDYADIKPLCTGEKTHGEEILEIVR